jgi:hypothetical protein
VHVEKVETEAGRSRLPAWIAANQAVTDAPARVEAWTRAIGSGRFHDDSRRRGSQIYLRVNAR